MKHSIVLVGLFGLTLTLLFHIREAAAGGFIGDTPGRVMHSPGYMGVGATLNITVGIDNTSANAAAMEISVQNVVKTWNDLIASTGNLVTGATNNIPAGMIDFESVALHELGHALGLGHPNVADKVVPGESNFTNSTTGANATFDFDAGADGIPGSSDDQRGDDVNLNWFRRSNNNPFTIDSTIDSTTYSSDVNDLPIGHDYPANADRSVGAALGVVNTESVMQQGTFSDEAQRTLNHDDVATLRFAMSGVDEIAGTADDYSINLIYSGQVPPGGADIVINFDNSKTMFAVTSVSFFVDGNHPRIVSSEVFFNDTVNWFFNDTLSVSQTVLIANFMNGNDTLLASRIYLWNPSASAGNVTVRVFTLERSGASTLLGTVDLGNLEATSARNIKLAEDILDPLGRRPYTDNDGDLTLEFTIGASGVKGAAQVFNNSLTLAFGTYPLQEILTSNVSPTVLVANFSNGNDTALASRVYLWNPSTSAGNVMVRVFTLERSGASTLLGTVDLGDLEATSARNIKLAEDILEPLGRRPHTDNGGNLMLEFTIQAANVRGAAQVFNNSQTLAFGVYPLQGIPTSNVSPTVLVANFMNGNDTELASRVYLWNPSTSAGNVMVRVFTLGRGEASTLLGTVNLGDLEATSARNIKLAEDILEPLGRRPHTDNGGNLTLEFTIQAVNVRGVAQVFDNSQTLAFGTYPLQEIPTSNVSPTVLVANFMNGNDTLLASRVYLWNPSTSAGNVSVRVFTLGRGEASTLLGTVNLGDLEATSARNIKLAEDILEPLGRRPHTDNGGNLMLEFTIQAANVLGAAQVFNNSLTLAFGTYPLSEVPE